MEPSAIAPAALRPPPPTSPPGPPQIRNWNISRSGAAITVTGSDIAGRAVKVANVLHVTCSGGRIEARTATGIYELVL